MQAARDLEQEALDRRRRVLVPDRPRHPRLGQQPGRRPARARYVQAARDLEQQALHGRRIVGPDHPDTLTSEGSLIIDRDDLGEAQ